MPPPTRFTVCAYNVWADSRAEERKEPLRQFLSSHQPDILCLQELRPWSRDLIDGALPTHERVDDPFEGWLREGNVYWNAELFELVEHGAENVGMFEELRRLFWARLAVCGTDRTLFVSTAHYTWVGNAVEKEGGASPRFEQAKRTVAALDSLQRDNEPQLFMGDLNDHAHPIRILREGGLILAQETLMRNPVYTFPAVPTSHGAPQTIDWMLHRGPIRPMTVEVVDFFHNDIAPSDHKPVLTTYRLT